MVNRIGRLAGICAFVLMLLRLGRLLDNGAEAPAWQLIMVASAFLGGVIWWLLTQTIANKRVAIALFSLAGLALFLRISVPSTLIGGFLPGAGTPAALGKEMAQTLDLIRFGVSPVFPTSGLVAVLSVLMWATGALFVWGGSGGPALAMFLPSIGLYLQFAVMDRIPAGRGWMAAAAIVIALGITSLAVERRSESGRVRDLEGRPLAQRAGAMAFVVTLIVGIGSVAAAYATAPLVPINGHVRWRLGGGYGPGGSGVSFDRLADLQQSIIRRTNNVMFRATLDPSAPPANEIYWRMESLDVFDGTAWRPAADPTDFYLPGVGGGDPAYAYRGSTQLVTQRVQIDGLRSQVVPTAGIGQYFRSDTVNVNGFQITSSGAAIYQTEMSKGDQYEVQSVLTMDQDDLAALATLPDGTLSPLFANAAAAGAITFEPGTPPQDLGEPSDIEKYLDLPDDLPDELVSIAKEHTTGAATVFEEAWLLQRWFRESNDFQYSVDVSTGHGSLDLVDWLSEPDSLNYRTGYCEQFAAAMAVLGRALGIPSRVVWGFTPGKVETQSDGSEVVVVTDHNAHAWVEMWMDGFGWVHFDPTPRSDGALPPSVTAAFDPEQFLPPPSERNPLVIARPGNFDDLNDPLNRIDLSDNPIGATRSGFSVRGWWVPVTAVLLLVALIGSVPTVKAIRRRRRLKRLREGDVTAAWDEIVDRLADLGNPVAEYQTPLEFAHGADRSLVPLATSYAAAVYGDRNGSGKESDLDVVDNWLRVRFDGGERAIALFNPRSLIDRGGRGGSAK
jgi:transglutaminase-like putative cysteine protease